MADSSIAVTPGSGANVDTRTVTGGDHRQVVCVGAENTTGVASVLAASTAAVAADLPLAVALHPTSPTPLPTLTKATQGTTGVSVQPLRDAGRVSLAYNNSGQNALATGAEYLLMLSRSADGGTVTNANTFVVTAGKRFRITNWMVMATGHATATTAQVTFRMRYNAAGAVTTTSNVLWEIRLIIPNTSLWTEQVNMPLPDGWEIAGGATVNWGLSYSATYVTNAPMLQTMIMGFEY